MRRHRNSGMILYYSDSDILSYVNGYSTHFLSEIGNPIGSETQSVRVNRPQGRQKRIPNNAVFFAHIITSMWWLFLLGNESWSYIFLVISCCMYQSSILWENKEWTDFSVGKALKVWLETRSFHTWDFTYISVIPCWCIQMRLFESPTFLRCLATSF